MGARVSLSLSGRPTRESLGGSAEPARGGDFTRQEARVAAAGGASRVAARGQTEGAGASRGGGPLGGLRAGLSWGLVCKEGPPGAGMLPTFFWCRRCTRTGRASVSPNTSPSVVGSACSSLWRGADVTSRDSTAGSFGRSQDKFGRCLCFCTLRFMVMSFGEGAGPEDRRPARRRRPQWPDPQLCSLSLPEPVDKHIVSWGVDTWRWFSRRS